MRLKAHLDELNAASDPPADALNSSLAFLGNMDNRFPSIPETDRAAARTAVTNERVAAINRYLDRLANFKPEDDEPPAPSEELQNKARKDLKSALTDAESENLSDMLDARCSEARRSWDAYRFPKRASELETKLKNAGASPANALRDSLAFLNSMTNDYPTVSKDKFIDAQNSIAKARKECLEAFKKSIDDKWKVKGNKKPEFDIAKIRDEVLTKSAVTDAEYEAFATDMNSRFNKASNTWDESQKRQIDGFVRDNFSSTAAACDALNKYMTFRQEHQKTSHVATLDSKMVELLEKRIAELLREYNNEFRGTNAVWRTSDNRAIRMNNAQAWFNEFKRLCLALGNSLLDDTPVKKSWIAVFAKRCVDEGKLKDSGINGAFQQKFSLSRIDVKVDFTSKTSGFDYFQMGVKVISRQWNEGVKTSLDKQLMEKSSSKKKF